MEYAEIGIIGGSGFYDLDGMEERSCRQAENPVRFAYRKNSCSAGSATAPWRFYPGTAMAIILILPKSITGPTSTP